MKKKYLPLLLKQDEWNKKSKLAERWFQTLKDQFCKEFLNINYILLSTALAHFTVSLLP